MKVSFSGIISGLICTGIGFFLLSGSWSAYAEYKRVQNYSERSIGRVINKHFKRASDGGGNYYIEYLFISSDGNKINGSSILAKQQWDVLQVDDTIEIRYDQSEPSRSIYMSGGGQSLIFAFFMLAMGTVFTVFGCLRFFQSFRKVPHKSNKILKTREKEK